MRSMETVSIDDVEIADTRDHREEIDGRLMLETLLKIADTLTERERRVFVARYVKEQTYKSISAMVGVSPERTRMIACKSLRKMRQPDRFWPILSMLYGRTIQEERKVQHAQAETQAKLELERYRIARIKDEYEREKERERRRKEKQLEQNLYLENLRDAFIKCRYSPQWRHPPLWMDVIKREDGKLVLVDVLGVPVQGDGIWLDAYTYAVAFAKHKI